MLVRLLYTSRMKAPSEAQLIDQILERARQHNARQGITGVLVCGNGLFLQALEGERSQVSELYSHIVNDKRHTDVVLVGYGEIAERRFGDWAMGRVNLTELNAEMLASGGSKDGFNPYAISGAMSYALVDELMESAAIMGRTPPTRGLTTYQ